MNDAATPTQRPIRLALFRDFAEEQWPSMELCADMLADQLRRNFADRVRLTEVRPRFRRRFQSLPFVGTKKAAFNADRLVNRFWDYPRQAAGFQDAADCFHVVDHSYAQLLERLPAERTGVFCHDLDTFRCLLEPERERRPAWFRRMARRVLDGFQQAAIVFHTTDVVRRQILDANLVEPARLVKAPLGTAPEFRLGGDMANLPMAVRSELQRPGRGPMLLHVGSCIPRKRIDVLLDVFALVRRNVPGAWLVQGGGQWTPAQAERIERLGIAADVFRTGTISRSAIAELYRQAAIVLLPSEAEGFGLPVAEAMACGAIVVTSDIPVFHEVGGDAAVYAPLADVDAWAIAVERLLTNPETAPDTDVRLRRAGRFTWEAHARVIVDAYERLLSGKLGTSTSEPGKQTERP